VVIDLDKGYDPGAIEDKWYAYWEAEKLFLADSKSDAPHYSIVIPPPNVTGSLHMGHALNNTLQDILIRTKRMQGKNTLWMPGTDHAGIATQNVVEKELAKEGKTRHDLGREKFVERVWRWKEEYGGLIITQLKKLGASCDWSRERFTMDEGLSRAVRKVFVDLYRDGLIYKDDYIINWCPRCLTALADLEVEHRDEKGSLYYIRYPVIGEDGKYVVVATTRPETMFGDTAVAVHPDDERYASLKGKRVQLPIILRELPIIFDPYVSVEFGTGALKVTPAHDLNDFEIGNDHELERVVVIDEDGTMNDGAGPYVGMDRFEAREKVVSDLAEKGLLEKVEDYTVPVGHCYRCRTVVEPLLSKQWFVRAEVLAQEAIRAVEDGRTKIVPLQWEKTYFEWVRNIRPWCISRQIWWGHRIPVWYCEDCDEVIVTTDEPTACPSCSAKNIRQDSDVLDTWFSSALWPFSTLGWPEKTKDLEVYYPTSCLVTGFDILFFWVARMMMMGLYCMGDVPFTHVYIHALVRDPEGRKMSKSLGNIIDPLVVIDEYGADAFRFTLAAFAAMGRDIKLSESRIEGYRFFINKLWNAARFVLMNLDDGYISSFSKQANFDFGGRALSLADRWILSRLQGVIATVTRAIEGYEFNTAATTLYQFVWHEFCDWYLELSKIDLSSDDESTRRRVRDILVYTLDTTLRLLHPFIPFVTEELFKKLPTDQGSIVKASFPEADQSLVFSEADALFQRIQDVVVGIRNIRGEMNIHPKKELTAVISAHTSGDLKPIEENSLYVKMLAGVLELTVGEDLPAPEASATAVAGPLTISVPLRGIIDFAEEKTRLTKEVERLDEELSRVEVKLSDDRFLTKAPPDVVQKQRDKKEDLLSRKERLLTSVMRIEQYSK
jgi:valyl-tRNA synthetase